MTKIELDPFRVILGVVARQQTSDLLLEVASAAGLPFDTSLPGPADFSHKTRVRALMPRIMAVRDQLDGSAALGAANALIAALASHEAIFAEAADALRRVGWQIRNGELIAADPDVREMFFPKGSQWDSFVVLRNLFAEASSELVIVDAYCDRTTFQLLSTRATKPLCVRILCSRSASDVAAESKVFVAQNAGWVIEVRQVRDFHDRFVVIDGRSCIHIGASINHAGRTAFMISRVEDQANQGALLAQIDASWSAATRIP
jgi:hypothetical protein